MRIGPAAVVAVARRPTLWPTAIATLFSLAPTGWWRGGDRLPRPDADWLRFRLVTAYGGDGSIPMRPEDLIAYLHWRRGRA